MTGSALTKALAPFDADAMTALTSKGVLRRAGKATVAAQDDGYAVGEHVVKFDAEIIDKRGPAEGTSCTCPASGLCAHAVAAILFVRDTSDAEADTLDQGDAWDDLAALDIKAIEAFSGAQWRQSVALEAGAIVRTGGSVTLRVGLSDKPLGSVTFRPGSDVLDTALVQPVSANRKRLITAAALAVRVDQGHPRPDVAPRAVAVLPDGILADIRAALGRAATHPAEGARDAEDDLRMLALSTRVNAAPRLSQALLQAASGVQSVRRRQLDGSPTTLLSKLADAYALAAALDATPGDERLTGRLRRDYAGCEPFSAWVLGSEEWATATGTRGLTTWGYDADNNQMWQVVDARGAGQDPNFYPQSAYQSDWAGGPTRESLAGDLVTFSSPQIIKSDARLNASSRPARTDAAELTEEQIASWPITFDNWGAAQRWLTDQLPLGLDAKRGQKAWIARPTVLGKPRIDPITQDHVWPVADVSGQVLALRIPKHLDLADRLASGKLRLPKAMPMLVTSRRHPERGLSTNAIALFLTLSQTPPKGLSRLKKWRHPKKGLRPVSLTLDHLPKIEQGLSLRRQGIELPNMLADPDPFLALANRAARAAESATRLGSDMAQVARLAKDADGLGLETLALALRSVAKTPNPDAILRLIYLTDQLALSAVEG